MKLISNLFSKRKDGGSESPVDVYFLIESKPLFSVALLKFNKGYRENYHTHAFNAYTWFIFGHMVDQDVNGSEYNYTRGIMPKVTKRDKNHRVIAISDSWCITFRGRWVDKWTEYNSKEDKTITMTHGRKIVD